MSTVRELLDEIRAASAGVPEPDAEPEAVLEAVEVMMVRRQPAFTALQTAIERGGEHGPEVRDAAAAVAALDREWRTRMEAALSTLARRLDGARKLERARPRRAVPGYVSFEI